jgi:hypothetical protein
MKADDTVIVGVGVIAAVVTISIGVWWGLYLTVRWIIE